MRKKWMKTGLSLGLSICLVVGTAGCGQSTSDTAHTKADEGATVQTQVAADESDATTEGLSTNQTSQAEDELTESKSAAESTEEFLDIEPMDNGFSMEACEDIAMLVPAEKCWIPEEEFNTEEYEKNDENSFCITQTNPLSTFSADVDTSSYSNVRRMIQDGYDADMIPADSVRAEEFINYFSYNLTYPKSGELFGVTTKVAQCPWNADHELMLVGMRTQKIDLSEAGDSNLVFLLDVSGSMDEPDKLPLLQKSFALLTQELGEKDRVSIVTYANGVELVLSGARGDEKDKILSALDGLYAGGGTNGEDGIQMAYQQAQKNWIEGGNNRVILATDGDLNIGISEPDELEKFISEKRESGIYLSVLGFGTGNLKDNNMERLADCGNGNYAYIDSVYEAKKVLVEEMGATLVTVADDVKLQVEFNPQMVNSYRLIGYENRMLADSEFRDDSVDAGEIGAGHSVVALYELIPAGSKDAVSLKYQKNEDKAENTSTYDGEYATVSVRYKDPGQTKAKEFSFVADASSKVGNEDQDLVTAAMAAELAMILAKNSQTGTASYEEIGDLYHKLSAPDEYQQEFYYMVRELAGR